MSNFLEILYQKHSARPNISGKSGPPEFDRVAGAWVNPTKAQHALLLLVAAEEGVLRCQIPLRPKDRFRLGQINFTSLYPDAVVAFRLWCAARRYDQRDWRFVPDVSWHLAFRLHSEDVDSIKRTFEGHSQSGIEFRFVPERGDLAVYTQRQVIPCRYLQAGLLLNNRENELIGFEDYRYSDVTDSIRDFVRIRPFISSATKSS